MTLRPNRAWCSSIASILGSTVIGLGLMVLIGWYTDSISLIQIRAAFVPMQYNTALSFLLLGGALVGLVRGLDRFAQVLGGTVASLATATLAQYLFQFDLGIDQALMEHSITMASHPGRMAPNTAVSFILSGLGILAAVRLHPEKRADWVLGLSGSVVTGLGLIAVLGYWSGVSSAYGWGQLTQMAIHTAVGFLVVGTGMTLRAVHEGIERRPNHRLPHWLPISFGLGMLTVSVSMWAALTVQTASLAWLLPSLVGLLGVAGSILTTTTAWFALSARARAKESEIAGAELRRWQLVFENAGWGLVLADARTNRMIAVNPAFAKMHGQTVGELRGQPLGDLMSPKNRELLAARAAQVHDSGHISYESTHLKKDGTTFSVLADVVSIADANGTALLRAANVQDITQRSLAETRLAESEERFRLLSEVAPVAVYLTDADGKCTFVNHLWREMTGLAADDALGDAWRNALHPDDRDRLSDAWARMVNSEGRWGLEYRLRGPEGKVTWVYGLASALRSADGLVTGYVGANVDITDRKKSEDLLKHREAQLSTILETSPDRVWLLDNDLNVLFGNRAALLGSLASVGKSVVESLSADRRVGAQTHLKRALHSLTTYRYEVTVTGPDGQDSIFDNVAVPIRTDGNVDGLAIVSRDVSEDRRTAYHDQHADRLAAIGRLAAGIAHDFNNVLGVISLYTKLVAGDQNMGTKTRERLGTILENCDHAKNLTRQILDYGRRGVMERRPTDLSELLKQLLKLLGHSFPRDIVLTPIVGKRLPLVNIDRERIKQALLNLSLNARDSMPHGGELRIELDQVQVTTPREAPVPGMPAGDWVGITVSDTGEGIPEAEFDHIFEPFYTTKPAGLGTGLGLSQVYGIIKQHDGHLDVKTAEGKGTTFYLYLPAL